MSTRSRTPRSNGSCPTGYHPRKAYTVRRTGTRVARRCVRATTTAGETHAEFVARTRRRMSRRLQGIPVAKRGITRCGKGSILRKAYVRESARGKRVFVPASCIPDVGIPGKGLTKGLTKGQGIGPLRQGELARFGYKKVIELSTARRHLALAAAVKEYGALSVWRKLNAVYIYTRHSSPASSEVFRSDRDWIKEHYGIEAF